MSNLLHGITSASVWILNQMLYGTVLVHKHQSYWSLWLITGRYKLKARMKLLSPCFRNWFKKKMRGSMRVGNACAQKGPLLCCLWSQQHWLLKKQMEAKCFCFTVRATVLSPNGRLFFDLLWHTHDDCARKISIYFPEFVHKFRWLCD